GGNVPEIFESFDSFNNFAAVSHEDRKYSQNNSSNRPVRPVSSNEEGSPDPLIMFLRHKSPTSTISRKLVSPFINTSAEFPPMIFLEGDSEELDDSSFEWYSHTWNDKVPEYRFEETDSDADNTIDEIRRQIQIKKEKVKPITVKCCADLAGNTYLQEENSKPDLCSYICNKDLEKEGTEISDLFDYYYGEEKKKKYL
ncbi:15216_t:CDS:1, partial [Gigaspora rosea]